MCGGERFRLLVRSRVTSVKSLPFQPYTLTNWGDTFKDRGLTVIGNPGPRSQSPLKASDVWHSAGLFLQAESAIQTLLEEPSSTFLCSSAVLGVRYAGSVLHCRTIRSSQSKLVPFVSICGECLTSASVATDCNERGSH